MPIKTPQPNYESQIGLRAGLHFAMSWTLLATAVRIGTALGLPVKKPNGWPVADLEVGQWLWYSIGMLDCQTSLDRGFPTILPFEDFTYPPPYMNDPEFSQPPIKQLTLQGPWSPSTDITFCYITHQVTLCLKKLSAPTPDSENSWNDWNNKVGTIAGFEESMRQYFSRLSDTTSPFSRFTQFAAEDFALNMHLLIRRPVYRLKHNPIPPWDEFDILKETTEILERATKNSSDNSFMPWIWFGRSWAKWYALSVLLTELCTPRKGDLTQRAYAIAQESFSRYTDIIANTDSGMLWKPIVKLMRRVQRVRANSSQIPNDSMPRSYPDPNIPIFNHPAGQTGGSVMNNDHSKIEAHTMKGTNEQQFTATAKCTTTPCESGSDWQLMPNEDLELDEATSWFNWDLFLDDMSGLNGFI